MRDGLEEVKNVVSWSANSHCLMFGAPVLRSVSSVTVCASKYTLFIEAGRISASNLHVFLGARNPAVDIQM